MKFLTLDCIKHQLRIDGDSEAEILDMYGSSAEETLLNYCNRTMEDIIEEYGKMPAPLIHAALMLVDVSYQFRSPVSTQHLSVVPYTFDILVKPYVKL